MESKFTVIFDAGHGGTTLADGSTPNNAVGPNGLLEKDLTLKIAKLTAAKVKSEGFEAILTREDDRNLSLAERARKSREEGADAFVSIHFNGSRNSGTDGTEVYVSSSSDKNDFNLADELLKNVSDAASTKGKGVCVADFTILKGDYHVAKTAACLIEMAYLTNPRQAQKLHSPEYIENLSTAVAHSIAAYAQNSAHAATLAEETFETTIAEVSKEHADPKNVPIDFPEPGKGTDTIQISIPSGLKFSRWEVEVTAMSTGAGYAVKQTPRSGAEGNQQITIDWWHLPYGKIKFKFKAYASPDGTSTAIEKVVFDKAGWMEKAKDQITQGMPIQLAVKGEKAKQIYEAIQKYQAANPAKQAGGKAISMEPVTITVVVLVGIVIFGILVALGLLTLGAIIKMALDKGYDVKDTKFKAGVGEGQLRQDHEIAFNLTRPETSTSQSFPLAYENDLDERHFQPLETFALGGEPVVNIKKSVGKKGDNREEDVLAVKKRLMELGFDWMTLDKNVDAGTMQAIILFQSIVNNSRSLTGDGTIEVGKDSHRWLQAVNAPQWEKIPKGSAAEGFENYEYDSEKKHFFGTNWMAETLIGAGAHYRDNYLKSNPTASLLKVNDVSLVRGGKAPPHAGHQTGLDCDIQLPRTNGGAGGINISIPKEATLYDRNAARAMLRALRAQPCFSQILFNDQTLINEGLCVASDASHYHHIHLDIKSPVRGEIEIEPLRHYHSGGRLYQGSEQDDIDYQTHALDAPCGISNEIPAGADFFQFGAMNVKSDLPSATEKNVCLRWNKISANTCEIDVVVHFHGYDIHEIGKKTSFFKYVESISGLKLAKRQPPTLCILPFGNSFGIENSTDIGYAFPFITRAEDGLQQLIDFGLKEIAKSSTPNFKVRRLILTAHSGGGAAVAQMLSFKKKYSINEIHLFDALYGCKKTKDEGCQTRPIISWAQEKLVKDEINIKAGKPVENALRVIYLDTKSTAIKEVLDKLKTPLSDFYRIEHTDFKHDDIPNLYGPELLGNAGANLILEKPKAKQKSLSFEYDEPDYFAESETDFMNY